MKVDANRYSRTRSSKLTSCALLLVVLTLVITTCKHASEPPPDNGPDTTSHNFVWDQPVLLGDGSSSVLYDVAIINDTLAYAVGEISVLDSNGQFRNPPYNLAKWNGRTWRVQTVLYGYQGQTYFGALRSVFAFDVDNVWFGSGNMIHWDGQTFTSVELPAGVWGPYRMNKIWGSSGDNFYAVGDGGSTVHYSNSTWQKLASGTTLPIQDIWGGVNPTTGTTEVIAVASDPYTGYAREILKIGQTSVITLSDSGINRALSGIWFSPSSAYYVTGGGFYGKTSLDDARWLNGLQGSGLTVQYLDAVRANGINDVFAAGANGDLLHFNGSTWRNFREQTGLSYGEYYSIAVKGDLVMAVGENLARGAVAVGRRVR